MPVEFVTITAPGDSRIFPFRGLTDESLRRRREAPDGDLAGLFICEGARVTERALAAGYQPMSALVATDMVERLPKLPEGVPVYLGAPEVVEAIVGFRFHRGFVAAFHRPPTLDPAAVLARSRRILVAENVTDPTNLGTIVRSAAALGIDGLLVDPTTCDPLYRRVVRVSMGAIFALPFAQLDVFPDGLGVVSKAGFQVVGLTPDPTTPSLGTVPLAERVALVLGAEGPGITAATADRLDALAHIPMRPGIDSLNVAAAAAIASYVIGAV